jgi:hypothetical protein
MKRIAALLAMIAVCAVGCTTYVAPGAKGRVVDAATGQPIPNARVTRLFIPPTEFPMPGRFPGFPAVTAVSEKSGEFNLAPRYHRCPTTPRLGEVMPMSGEIPFIVSAEGYATYEVQGPGDATNSYRVQLGEIRLTKK